MSQSRRFHQLSSSLTSAATWRLIERFGHGKGCFAMPIHRQLSKRSSSFLVTKNFRRKILKQPQHFGFLRQTTPSPRPESLTCLKEGPQMKMFGGMKSRTDLHVLKDAPGAEDTPGFTSTHPNNISWIMCFMKLNRAIRLISCIRPLIIITVYSISW